MSLSRPRHTKPALLALGVALGSHALAVPPTSRADTATGPATSPPPTAVSPLAGTPPGVASAARAPDEPRAVGSRPGVPFERLSSAHLDDHTLTLRLRCRNSGQLWLADSARRPWRVAASRFRCRHGHAAVGLRLPRALMRRARTQSGTTVLAVIRAAGKSSSTPVAIRAPGGKGRRPAHAAHWGGDPYYPVSFCQPRLQSAGGGGWESVKVYQSNGFGASLGETIYWRAWILPYGGSWMASSWQYYTVAGTNSGYITNYGAVIGGTAAPGTSFNALWDGGLQYKYVSPRTYTIAGIEAGNPRIGYRFDYVYSTGSSAMANGWCYFP
jgi:hypothetical protein